MVTSELITYIRQQLAADVPKEKIVKVLTPNGWSSQDISQAFSSIDQKITNPSFIGRKILLSSGLIIASGLYAFFQYTANSPRTSAIVTYVPLPKQNVPASSSVADIQPSPSTPTVTERTPTPSAPPPQPVPLPVPTPTPVHKPVPAQIAVSHPVPAPVPTPPPAPIPTPKPAGKYADGTYTGRPVNAYYGIVQVDAVIQNGTLADVKILQYPNDRNTSVRINSQALPILKQEAIAAQSANIDAVSGASDTSPAFVASLSSALAQAKN